MIWGALFDFETDNREDDGSENVTDKNDKFAFFPTCSRLFQPF